MTRKITATVVIADNTEIIIEERNKTCVNIRCSRVSQKAVVMFMICQNIEEIGMVNNQKGLTSLSVPHGRDRRSGIRGGRLFHFHMMIEIEMMIQSPTILFVSGNIQFWFCAFHASFAFAKEVRSAVLMFMSFL